MIDDVYLYPKSFKMKTYEFVDAQDMHRNHPQTFEVPSNEDLNGISKYDFVKVSCNNERFWIEVTSVDGDKIKGTVSNGLFMEGNEELVFGKEIEVTKNNVFDIIKD